MRFTVDPAWDLEVTEGVTLGECREALAALAGIPADARLVATGAGLQDDQVGVRDDQVAGVPPWVAGSRLAVAGGRGGGEPAGADGSAGRDRWCVAVVAGPDAGAVGAPAGGRLTIGGGSSGAGALALHDPEAATRRLVVRRVARRWLVRVRGREGHGRNGGELGEAPARRLRQGRRGRPLRVRRIRAAALLRAGDLCVLGATTVQVRPASPAPRPGSGPGLDPGHDGRPEREPAAVGRRGGSAPPLPPGRGTTAGPAPGIAALTVPLVVGLVLAGVTRSPVYLLLAVAGPATTGLPLLVARLRRRRRQPPPDLGPDPARCLSAPSALPPWWPLATAGLAVVGPAEATEAAARALVGGALLSPRLRLVLLLRPERAGRWAWCRWLEPRLGPAARAGVARDDAEADAALAAPAAPDSPLLVVAAEPPCRIALERWSLRRRGPSDGVVVLAATDADAPPWCAWTLAVRGDGTGLLTGPGTRAAVSVPFASVSWAETHARSLAARDAALAGEASPDLPAAVGLAALGLPDDVPGVLARWAGPVGDGLTVPVGVGADGVVTVDLRADGPHGLVAGTTGAGKSELLQGLVLGLALAHPPDRLAMVLLDFKGGAGVGRCAGLPHVVGAVTDLDPGEAGRALEGLRAELRRREALVSAAGASDVSDVPGVPRLLVVVDEFQALTEDLPDFVPSLVRLAAQGRSLGFHLVLATQRPGGAVSPQMRANLALRICLRVMDAGESIDVVDVPTAATLPADRPGRAVLRRGSGPPEVLQASWAALPPGADPVLRLAPAWSEFGPWGGAPAAVPSADGAAVAAPQGGADTGRRLPDHTEHLLDVIGTAAAAAGPGRGPGARLWPPALPVDVRRADLVVPGPAGSDEAAGGLVLGVTDPPGSREHGLLRWSGRGLLAVVGATGSGRSTTVATVLQAALAAGVHAHLVAGGGLPDPALTAGVGTLVTADDPRRIARLLALLTSRAPAPSHAPAPSRTPAPSHTPAPSRTPTTPGGPSASPPPHGVLLAVDDVALVLRALDAVPRGLGTDLLERALRDGPHHGLAVVVTGEPRDMARWTPTASHRLVLGVADSHDDAALGVPAALAGPRRAAGRAISLRPGEAVRCQVALPDIRRPPPSSSGSTPRVATLPLVVEPPGPPVSPGWSVPLGLGGDDAGPVLVDVTAGLLVAGPGGSGRSTALAVVVTGLLAAGRSVAVVAAEGPLATLAAGPLGRHPGLAGWTADTPAAATRLVERCAQEARDVVVVDDADQLCRADPGLDDTLAGWVLSRQTGGSPRPAVVAAARTDRAAAAYRGVCAALRGAPAVVLSALEPGSADVAGADVALAADPARPRHPGRGVVARAGSVVPVQVTAWQVTAWQVTG